MRQKTIPYYKYSALKRVSSSAQGYGGQGERKYLEADVSASFLVKRSFPLPQEPSPLVRNQAG